jgi:probable DNA metabolism protein
MTKIILQYDGSFDGLLSAIFYVYEYKLSDVEIQRDTEPKPLFGEVIFVPIDDEKAKRVWKSIKEKSKNSWKFYYSFLSERSDMERTLLAYAQHVFDQGNVAGDYGNDAVMQVSKIAKSVGREKHRMEAFVRFRLTKDNIYFATIEPDFNVLPIILKHFKSRYADQEWIIYDLKRKYGIRYDLEKVEEVQFDFENNFNPTETSELIFAQEELEFQELWKNYFKSTNIKSRKNMKLHIRHVPKRYWKYLSEKQF